MSSSGVRSALECWELIDGHREALVPTPMMECRNRTWRRGRRRIMSQRVFLAEVEVVEKGTVGVLTGKVALLCHKLVDRCIIGDDLCRRPQRLIKTFDLCLCAPTRPACVELCPLEEGLNARGKRLKIVALRSNVARSQSHRRRYNRMPHRQDLLPQEIVRHGLMHLRHDG